MTEQEPEQVEEREAKVPADDAEVDQMLSTQGELYKHTGALGVDAAASYVAAKAHVLIHATAGIKSDSVTIEDLQRLDRQAFAKAREVVAETSEEHVETLENVHEALQEA